MLRLALALVWLCFDVVCIPAREAVLSGRAGSVVTLLRSVTKTPGGTRGGGQRSSRRRQVCAARQSSHRFYYGGDNNTVG